MVDLHVQVQGTLLQQVTAQKLHATLHRHNSSKNSHRHLKPTFSIRLANSNAKGAFRADSA